MMNIQSEIREYILSHDFVMLPGIGAFVAEYSKPYFGPDGEIVPSERKIRFNPLLRNDSDVEILQVFKERMNISDAEVQEQYFALLDSVNEQIGAFNRYYWEGLGILLREGPDQALQFVPFQVRTDPPVQAPAKEPVNFPAVSEPQEEDFLPEDRVAEQESYRFKEEPVMQEEETDQYEEEPVEDSTEENRAMKYLVFALPLALLTAALVYMVFFKPSLRENVKEKKEPAVLNEPDLSGEEVTVDTLYIEPAPQRPEVQAEEHVVRVGIYKREKDAEKIVAFLADKGYDAKIRMHGPLFKVYLLADTEEQAVRYIKEVERLIDDTPIYERKKRNG